MAPMLIAIAAVVESKKFRQAGRQEGREGNKK
jgi:hypothetical protein